MNPCWWIEHVSRRLNWKEFGLVSGLELRMMRKNCGVVLQDWLDFSKILQQGQLQTIQKLSWQNQRRTKKSFGMGAESSLRTLQRPSNTRGRWWNQFVPDSWALRDTLRQRWNLSTRPMDCGWKVYDSKEPAETNPDGAHGLCSMIIRDVYRCKSKRWDPGSE